MKEPDKQEHRLRESSCLASRPVNRCGAHPWDIWTDWLDAVWPVNPSSQSLAGWGQHLQMDEHGPTKSAAVKPLIKSGESDHVKLLNCDHRVASGRLFFASLSHPTVVIKKTWVSSHSTAFISTYITYFLHSPLKESVSDATHVNKTQLYMFLFGSSSSPQIHLKTCRGHPTPATKCSHTGAKKCQFKCLKIVSFLFMLQSWLAVRSVPLGSERMDSWLVLISADILRLIPHEEHLLASCTSNQQRPSCWNLQLRREIFFFSWVVRINAQLVMRERGILARLLLLLKTPEKVQLSSPTLMLEKQQEA